MEFNYSKMIIEIFEEILEETEKMCRVIGEAPKKCRSLQSLTVKNQAI